jgi:N-acetylglucosamine kinase-like BadF-type ATPase
LKKIIIGIEGGGTSTRMLLQVDQNEPVYLERKGSLKFTGGKFEHSAATLLDLLRSFPDFKPMWVRAMAIGLSGASQPAEQEAYRAALRFAFANPTLPIHIESDASLSFKAAVIDDEPGMLLVAGTGTALLVRDHNEEMHLLGGWGTVLGDEGSGFWIGVEALKHVTRIVDKILPEDGLYEAILQHLPEGVRERPRILSRLIDSRSLIPSEIAPIVFLMSASDPTAKAILQLAASHLAEFVRSGLAQFAKETYAELHMVGSIARQPEMMKALKEALKDLPIVLREVGDRAPAELALQIARTLKEASEAA